MNEDFEIIGGIEQITTIAVGSNIREIKRLRKAFGDARWRKLKGIATVRLGRWCNSPRGTSLARNTRNRAQETKDQELFLISCYA